MIKGSLEIILISILINYKGVFILNAVVKYLLDKNTFPTLAAKNKRLSSRNREKLKTSFILMA
jgi:hypothetical protein